MLWCFPVLLYAKDCLNDAPAICRVHYSFVGHGLEVLNGALIPAVHVHGADYVPAALNLNNEQVLVKQDARLLPRR